MANPIRFAGLAAVFALTIAACTGAAATAPPSPVPATSAPAASAAAGGATVAVAMTSLGDVLVGPNGLTLYTHKGDTATSSTCSGGCATAWPPLSVAAGQQPTAGTGAAGKLATLARADGTLQVTYAGLPLYYWKGDKAPGDVTGQGINGFSVALASGSAAAPSAAAPAPSASTSGGYSY